MKKLLFGLVATIMLSVSSFANNATKITIDPVQKANIEYSIGNKKVVVTKTFESQQEMEVFVNSELNKIDTAFQSALVDELQCSVTIHLGTESNFVEGTVSGPCSEIGAAIKKLKAQLMAAL
jgi:hypothetical protein